MKKNTMMMFALVAMTAGLTVNADEVQTISAPVAATQKASEETVKLSAEEISFSAKLNDQNRKAFCENFSVEQRKGAMVAAKNGANTDEAVQKMVALQEMKDAPAVH